MIAVYKEERNQDQDQYNAIKTRLRPMFNPVSNQFHITYKKREVPILIPIEQQLCKEMGLTRSDLHKNAIKRLWNSRQEKQLQLV